MMYIPKFNVNTLVSSFLQSEILAAKIALERSFSPNIEIVSLEALLHQGCISCGILLSGT